MDNHEIWRSSSRFPFILSGLEWKAAHAMVENMEKRIWEIKWHEIMQRGPRLLPAIVIIAGLGNVHLRSTHGHYISLHIYVSSNCLLWILLVPKNTLHFNVLVVFNKSPTCVCNVSFPGDLDWKKDQKHKNLKHNLSLTFVFKIVSRVRERGVCGPCSELGKGMAKQGPWERLSKTATHDTKTHTTRQQQSQNKNY